MALPFLLKKTATALLDDDAGAELEVGHARLGRAVDDLAPAAPVLPLEDLEAEDPR